MAAASCRCGLAARSPDPAAAKPYERPASVEKRGAHPPDGARRFNDEISDHQSEVLWHRGSALETAVLTVEIKSRGDAIAKLEAAAECFVVEVDRFGQPIGEKGETGFELEAIRDVIRWLAAH